MTTAAAIGLAGAAAAQEAPALEKPGFDTVVATVDGTDITAGEVILMRSRLPQQYQQMDDSQLYDMLLDQMINQQLLAEEVDAPSPMVQAALANEERTLLSGVVLQGVMQAAVTDEALQALYDETYSSAEPSREYHAAHILVGTQEEAQEIIDELNAGADFADLAKKKSTGPSGPNGGDLGWFGKGMMVPEFEEAVASLDAGQISAPVQTQFGWHVIKLEETRMSEAPALDDVRAELTQTLQRKAMEDKVNALADAGEVTRKSSQELDASFMSDPSFIQE
nr:peptidylprolyl isomerase [Mangrovicoccus sp. HB161399]